MNKEKKLMTDHALNSWESNHNETHKAISEITARINCAVWCIRRECIQDAMTHLQSALNNLAWVDFAHKAEHDSMDMLIQIRNLRPEPYPIPDPEPNPDEKEEAYRGQQGQCLRGQ